MDTEVPTFEQKGFSNMELTATKEIIVKLKAVKKENELTIPRIKEMVEKNGDYIAMSTLRRVFAEGSEENDSFSYDRTIAPIARALLFQDNEDIAEGDEAAIEDRVEGLRAVILLKNEQIDMLQEQNEMLRKQVQTVCAERDERLRFLRDQIELKDKRMDEKDAIIQRLMDKCL